MFVHFQLRFSHDKAPMFVTLASKSTVMYVSNLSERIDIVPSFQ